MSPEDAAKWMLQQLVKRKYFDQGSAAWELFKMDKSLTYYNANGNLAIDKAVLKEFNKLTSDGNVVWSRSERLWRFRQKWDKPGRMQD